jgi:hypothetical protein
MAQPLRPEIAAHTVGDLDRRLKQVYTAIEDAAKRGKTNAALRTMDDQRRTVAGWLAGCSSRATALDITILVGVACAIIAGWLSPSLRTGVCAMTA